MIEEVREDSGSITRGLHRLQRYPPMALLVVATLMAAGIGGIDLITARELSLSLFYFVPVAMVSWLVSTRHGYLLAGVCAGIWLLADVHSGAYKQDFIRVWNFGMRLGTFLVIAHLVGTLRRSLEHERHLARTDALTDLANTRHFLEMADQELARARRFGHLLGLAYIDIDDFKLVNDDLGHSAGDDLLRAVAAALKEATRATDTVARLGGDEFALLFPATGDGSTDVVLNRLTARLPRSVDGGGTRVTYSVGAVTFKTIPRSVDEMIWAADQVMYAVKREGKDRVRHTVLGRERHAAGITRSAVGSG